MYTNFTNPNLVTSNRSVIESAKAQLVFNYDSEGLALYLLVDGANLLHIPNGPGSIADLAEMTNRHLTIKSSPTEIASAILSMSPSFVYLDSNLFYVSSNISFPSGGLKVTTGDLRPINRNKNGNMDVIDMPLNANVAECSVMFATYPLGKIPGSKSAFHKPDMPDHEFVTGWVGVKVNGHDVEAHFYAGDPTPATGVHAGIIETEIHGKGIEGADAKSVAYAFMRNVEGMDAILGPVFINGLSSHEVTTDARGIVWIPLAYMLPHTH